MINLSRVIHSAMLAQGFEVERRGGHWENGTYTAEEPAVIPLHGIITQARARDLEAIPEADRQSGAIRVLTTERLYVTGEVSENGFSDVVIWNEERYRVISVTLNTDWGYCRSICARMRGSV